MSKINISLILSKSCVVLKKQPFIFIPFFILAFLSAMFTVATFDYNNSMMQEFQGISQGYAYSYDVSDYAPLYDLVNIFKTDAKLIAVLTVAGFVLWIIQVLLYTGMVSMIRDVTLDRKTTPGDFINISLSRGIIVILSSIAASIILYLPGMIGILLIVVGALSMSINLVFAAIIFFALQGLWLLAILFYLSSKVPRTIYIIITAITFAFLILGIFFIPLLFFVVLLGILLSLLIIISMILISFAIDYIIPSAVITGNVGVTDALLKSLAFTKDHTMNFGILILISFIIIFIVVIPFGIISAVLQIGNIGTPATADLIISIIRIFVITGIIGPFIMVFFVLGYINAGQGDEFLEKLND